MDNQVKISFLNDFIFCPISIYFHNLYGDTETLMYQNFHQIKGKNIHKTIDDNRYSTRKNILTSIDVFSEKYNLYGKIDIYNLETKTLIERKNCVETIYDGYILQLYAQYFCMIEMGYEIEQLEIHSVSNNKKYIVNLPTKNVEMFTKFENIIETIINFNIEEFRQENKIKCMNCIYEPACDRSLL